MNNSIMDDSSARRILIIEDEDDLDLDKLLLCDTSARESFTSTGHISPPPSPKSLSPSSLSSSIKNHASVSSAASVAAMPPTGHHSSLLKTTTTCPPIILASEEGEDSVGRWILPTPALPGDYLNGSLHRVPSKSILKKTSSYGNFDSVLSSSRGGGSSTTPGRTRRPSIAMDSSSTSQASHSRGRYNNRSQVSDEPPSSSSPGEASPKNNIPKKTSFLSFASLESNTSQSQQQNQHGGNSIGWDLDADDALSASSPLRNISPLAEDESLPSIPSSRHVGDAAGAGGGGASSESRNSDSSTRIRRNVSFHAVDVREYDRTVGDHPGCRSGPPLSLDWSYSKKYQKNLDEFELERNSHRVNHFSELHMNKYKRRNLLAFQWGHSEDEMKEARSHTKKMQRQRNMTQLLQPVHMAEEAIIDFKNFITKKKKTKKKKGSSEIDDWSDISNSISTKDSSHRGIRSMNHMLFLRQDAGGLQSSTHTT